MTHTFIVAPNWTTIVVMTLKKKKNWLDLCAITKAKISKLGRLIMPYPTLRLSGLCCCNKAGRISPKTTVSLPENPNIVREIRLNLTTDFVQE